MAKKFVFKPLADFPELKPEDHHKYYVKGKTVRVTKAGLPWKKTTRTTTAGDEKIKVSTFDKEKTTAGDEKIFSSVVFSRDDKESNLAYLASTLSIVVNTLACSFFGPEVAMSPAEMKVTAAANKNYLKTLEGDAMSPELVLLLAYFPLIVKCATSEKMKDKLSKGKEQADPVSEVFTKKADDLEYGQDEPPLHIYKTSEVMTALSKKNKKEARKGKK